MAKKFMYACFGILALVVAFHLGAQYGQASSYGSDIAIGIGNIGHNQQIPLPYYPDGTQATQDECTWIVAPWELRSGHNSTLGFKCQGKANRIVGFTQVTIEGTYYDSIARYLIIGVRGGASVTQPATWGKIKAEFGE